jgi:hypothetical protein
VDAQPKKESSNLKVAGEQCHRALDAAPGSSRASALVSSSTLTAKRTVHSCDTAAARSIVRKIASESLPAALLCMGLACAAPSFVAAATLPSKPQSQSASSKAVQPQVEKQASDSAAQKRKALLADATAAIAETEHALQALDDNNKDVALKALADASGKLELVIARDPKLALAPVHVDIVTHDLFANPGTVSAVLLEVRKNLDAGNVQDARRLIAALASDIEVNTTNIPLATYPAAIRAITPLIDAGKIGEAKTQLQAALDTLVVTTDVIPLPKVRAEGLLKQAQMLADKANRTKDENDQLDKDLRSAREQLQLSELLGYGRKADYKPMQEQLDQIANTSAGGKSGLGWFDKIKRQLSDQFKPLLGNT